MKRIFNTGFLFFHFNFSWSPSIQNSYTAGEFRKTFLKFLFIVIGGCFINLNLYFINPSLDSILTAGASNNRCVVFIRYNTLCGSKIFKSCIFQLIACIFRYKSSTSEYCNIFQHCFPAISKSGSFNSEDLKSAAQFVHNQGSQCFTFYILSDYQYRFPGLNNFLQKGK